MRVAVCAKTSFLLATFPMVAVTSRKRSSSWPQWSGYYEGVKWSNVIVVSVYSVRLPDPWKCLPVDVVIAQALGTFKRQLDVAWPPLFTTH